MQVKLIQCTQEPLKLIGLAARITHGIDNSSKSDEDYFKLLYKLGHHSVFEHVNFTFDIDGISRACSHQLVRFRLAAFTQRSQRYCSEKQTDYVIPPSIHNDRAKATLFYQTMTQLQDVYQALVDDGVPKEDARFILPNATTTRLIMTMNYRELMHACSLRRCSHAQWEIRQLFDEIAFLVFHEFPLLGEYLQPECFHNEKCSHQCAQFIDLMKRKEQLNER